jgi:hypothetical protein
LGIHKTISGDQTDQIAILTEKSNRFGKGITASSATPFEAWMGYFTIWYPSCNFPLAATFLTKPVCEKIQSFATCATLNKCGYNRHFPRSIVFGSQKYGSLAMQHLWYEQRIQHIIIIIKHLRTPGHTPGHFNSILQINLRWYLLIAGVSFQLLEFPTVNLPHLEGAWLTSTRGFLAYSRSQLLIPSLPTPKIFRLHDSFIMEAVLNLNYTAGQIKQVNSCRLFLQVTPVPPSDST